MKTKAIIIFTPLFLALFLIGGVLAALKIKDSLMPVMIGILKWEEGADYEENIAAFRESLADLGFAEGEDVAYLIRSAGADPDKQREAISFFRNSGVKLIYALTTPGTVIAKEAETALPIVFSIVTYPLEAGLAGSLQRSGNNLTGTRNWISSQIQLFNFLQLVPGVKTIGFLRHRGEPNSEAQLREFLRYQDLFGVRIIDVAVDDSADLPSALEASRSLNALYLACDTLVQGGGSEAVLSFLREKRMPAFTCTRSGVERGVLMGAVADLDEIGRLAGQKAAMILRGADPGQIEITTAARPFIYLNAATAARLNIEISQELAARAKKIFR